MILDNRFWLMWAMPIVASFFSVDVQMGGMATTLWHALKVAFYGFLVFYVFYFLLSFIKPQGLVRFLKNAMLVLSLSLTFIDFFVSYYFHMGFTPSLVGTLLATNVRESQEFLTSMVLPRLGFILGYLTTCVGFLYLVRFKLCLNMPQRLKTLVILFGLFWVHILSTYYLQGLHGVFIDPNITTRVIPVVKEVSAIIENFKDNQTKAIYQSFKQPYPKDYVHVDADSVPNVILVVGESASRNFMNLYGYRVPNTPLLSEIAKHRSQNLFVFDNVISVFANTYTVFRTLLNYGDVENHAGPWFQQKNLGRIFNLAGYKTFWIDAQDNLDGNNVFAFLAHPFTHKYWANGPLDIQNSTQDGWTLEVFKHHVQSQLASKNFILFHLFGSHAIYHRRFPKSFAKFSPTQIPYENLHVQDNADKQIVADYVNSLYYTDYILHEIFQFFSTQDAIILYLSDHAEDVFESDRNYGHRCSTYGVEIPFVIYVTDLFKQKHPQKVRQLAQAVHKPFMSDDLIHTLLPLAGIHTKDNLESKDLLSPRFDAMRRRTYCGNQYPSDTLKIPTNR
ncbi:phosphoethanolamine transferase [Helicobacter salomonis]|uniref:phosphoethanolamine transferase n=1 Tax=Helicobacter salomonis TaxID=56878 RepID=UPI000CF0546E|nr:phosphoethanolamine transferase [Helicobacter salomonis]